MPTISQFCLTCGDENLFEMTKGEVDHLFAELNIPPPANYSETIQLPPDDCDFCETYYYELYDEGWL